MLVSLVLSIAAEAAPNWTLPRGVVATGPGFSAARSECREFATYSTKPWSSAPDGFIVAKNGVVEFEYYDAAYGPNRPHALWSVTKTVTGALMGIAERDGKIAFDEKLSLYYPRAKYDAAYESVRLSNLFYSDTGIVWDESTLDVTKNSVLQMLFGPGRADMASFVASKPIIPQGAGYHWRYTTGTPLLAHGVLAKAYGVEYSEFPWRDLFYPLGMTSMVLERDAEGTFAGSAYGFATPRDMLKLGELYLNRGRHKGKQLLPESWINRTLTISPGLLSPGTPREQLASGLNLVYGGLIWLNRHGRPDLPNPFPKSPDDMFMALGQYGQFILVIPSKNMVLVRTGRQGSIDDRIDGIVTRALACFDDPATPLADQPPGPPAHQKKIGVKAALSGLFKGMRSGVVQGAVAKWLCSCHFVSGLSIDSCLARSNIPQAKRITKVRVSGNSIEVKPSMLARAMTGAKSKRVATYDPVETQFGCRLEP